MQTVTALGSNEEEARSWSRRPAFDKNNLQEEGIYGPRSERSGCHCNGDVNFGGQVKALERAATIDSD